jgi:hypothetical protein
VVQERLFAEASTAAWQDYFLFNAGIALLCLFPALPFWRRTKYQATEALPSVREQAPSSTASHTPAPKSTSAARSK